WLVSCKCEVKIVAEVDVLEVIGEFDVSEEKMKLNASSDLVNKTEQLNETVDVNGFQIFPSQINFSLQPIHFKPSLCHVQHCNRCFIQIII
ncbi:hypothetical protein EUTSA_v100280580mg, partial [Eutrema salsugineum]